MDNNAISIDLDIAFEGAEGLDDAIASLIGGRPIETFVVQSFGPAAGWPVVRFTGPSAAIASLVAEYEGQAS